MTKGGKHFGPGLRGKGAGTGALTDLPKEKIGDNMILSNRDFHTAVAEMSGNPFIAGWMRGLLDQGQRLLRLYARNLGDSLPDAVLKPHRDMVEAIAAGDADRAEEAGRADALVMVEEYKRELSNRPAALLLLHGGG